MQGLSSRVAQRSRSSADLDAQRLQVHLVPELAHAAAGGKQGLARHAATIHAGAANVVSLHHGHLQPLSSEEAILDVHIVTGEYTRRDLALNSNSRTVLAYR